jgi:hypothetical protein
VECSLIKATGLAREGKVQDAGALLHAQAKISPSSKLNLQLAAVQLYLAEVCINIYRKLLMYF